MSEWFCFLYKSKVVDESGEEYLFPASFFIDANLSKEASDAVTKAA